jgi:hypothetical protein
MKRKFILATVCIALLGLAAWAHGPQDESAPLSGDWDCKAQGGSQGEIPFTLHLTQAGETVTGTVNSSIGDATISSATFKDDKLEIRIGSTQDGYVLTGKLDSKGKLVGEWSHDPEKGTWEGSKAEAAN